MHIIRVGSVFNRLNKKRTLRFLFPFDISFSFTEHLWCEKMISELDLKSLWKELDEYEVEMEKETRSLQEVWVKIAQIKSTNESEISR